MAILQACSRGKLDKVTIDLTWYPFDPSRKCVEHYLQLNWMCYYIKEIHQFLSKMIPEVDELAEMEISDDGSSKVDLYYSFQPEKWSVCDFHW
jgi:hypothetical protein